MSHRLLLDPYRRPPGRHRYWRLLFSGIAGVGTRIGLDEIEFWSDPGGTRVPHSAVAASGFLGVSTDPAYAADGLLLGDGSNNEIWVSQTTGPWWYSFDAGLGNDFDLAAIALARGNYLTTGYDTPTGFDVQWSDDNATWTTVWTESAIPGGWHGWDVRTFYNPSFSGNPAATAPIPSTPQFWLKIDDGVFSDAGSTPAADGDPIRQITNHGSDPAFGQSTLANRPVFRTGGLNGKPYLEANGVDQFLEDISTPVASGLLVFPTWTVFTLTDAVDITNNPAILGHPTVVAKNSYYFESGGNHRYVKSGLDYGAPTWPLSHAVFMESSNRRVDFFNGVGSTFNNASSTPSTVVTVSQFLRHVALGVGQGYFKGRLYEFLLFPGTLSALEVNRIEKYLRYKYGL